MHGARGVRNDPASSGAIAATGCSRRSVVPADALITKGQKPYLAGDDEQES
jgi:hypothetical protein